MSDPPPTRLCCDLAEIPGQARARLVVRGGDAERFLDGLLSCRVREAVAARAVPGVLLTVKGKIVSEVIVLPGSASEIALLVPAALVGELQARLERHVILDDVVIERDPDAGVAVCWPEAPPTTSASVRRFAGEHPVPADLLVGPPSALAAVLEGCPRADAETFDRRRIEHGRPAWGHEIVPDRFPAEVGFDGAVDHEKGCFLGQEPIARIHARGHVNRVMVRVRGEGSPAAPGSLSSPSRADGGRLTTVVRDGAACSGLAIVHRELAVVGTVLSTTDGHTLRVESGPLGADPGIARKPPG